MHEVRVHGRGGQGTVMAIRMLASALVKEGRHAAAFPMFGAERRGAPVTAFLRIDESPIREKTQIYEPNCLIVVDPHLIKGHAQEIFSGLRSGSILVINAPQAAKGLYSPNVGVVGFVDATRICLEEIGVPVTNTCMMGAFARTTNWLRLESILGNLIEVFSGPLLEKNIRCAKRGFEEATVIKL